MSTQVASNIHWHEGNVTPAERHKNMGHKGVTLWMTGLSASGKSTIAVALEQVLLQRGRHAYRLDGDNIRFGLNKDARLLQEKSGYAEAPAKRFGLGFSAEDRTENIRRIGEVAKLFADAGVITITSFISPYKADRDAVRKMHVDAKLPYFEVYVDCNLAEAEKRDPKGLYKKARAGEIKGFTGIDDPYQAPESPELHLSTDRMSIAESVQALLDLLEQKGILHA